MVEGGASRDDIRLARPPSLNPWDRLEWWHKMILAAGIILVSVFGAGAGFQRVKASVVFADAQKAVDERQDSQIHAIQDDNGRMHVSLDDVHDEVRGMRTDMRFFDPRLRGGGLAPLPEETPRLTMPPPLASPTSTPKGTP